MYRLNKLLAQGKKGINFSKMSKYNFSQDLNMPIIDFDKFLNKRGGWEAECKLTAECLHETGILVVKEQRANQSDNQAFISMMERYFQKVSKKYYRGEKNPDIHPEFHYQVGPTPEFKEKPKSHCDMFSQYNKEDKPVSECPPVYDSKWRFFWYIGERDKELDKDMLIYPQVVPEGFPVWENTMNTWGNKLLGATEVAAKMIAHGFKLPEDTFYEKMKYGGHLLAPTGSDLNRFNVDTIFAGVHYDLNFLTIHGKSNFGGLYIWLRNGQKKRVRIPDGCLLIQAGIQLEYLTGGECLAGFHEVVYNQDVHDLVMKIKKENESKKPEDQRVLWRVSSTLFSQIRQNVLLEPLSMFKNQQSLTKYPPILTRDQVANELKAISLMTD